MNALRGALPVSPQPIVQARAPSAAVSGWAADFARAAGGIGAGGVGIGAGAEWAMQMQAQAQKGEITSKFNVEGTTQRGYLYLDK